MTRAVKSYKKYHPIYFNMLDHFRSSDADWNMTGKLGEMIGVKLTIGRFFNSLWEAFPAQRDKVEIPKGDTVMRGYGELAKMLQVVVEPARGNKDDPAILTVKIHPMCRGLNKPVF